MCENCDLCSETIAILSQGTHGAAAGMQAFLHFSSIEAPPSLLSASAGSKVSIDRFISAYLPIRQPTAHRSGDLAIHRSRDHAPKLERQSYAYIGRGVRGGGGAGAGGGGFFFRCGV